MEWMVLYKFWMLYIGNIFICIVLFLLGWVYVWLVGFYFKIVECVLYIYIILFIIEKLNFFKLKYIIYVYRIKISIWLK